MIKCKVNLGLYFVIVSIFSGFYEIKFFKYFILYIFWLLNGCVIFYVVCDNNLVWIIGMILYIVEYRWYSIKDMNGIIWILIIM